MNKNESHPTNSDNSCEPSTSCSSPSPNTPCKYRWTSVIFLIVLLLAGGVVAHSMLTKQDVAADQTAVQLKPVVQITPGTQEVCPVMGNPIKESVFVDYNGQRIYFCCPGCDTKFQAEPDKYLAIMAEAGVTIAKVVTNGNGEAPAEEACEDCGGMEGSEPMAPMAMADVQVTPGTQTMCPVVPTHPIKDVFIDYDGKRIYLCCAGCIDKFNAEPETFISKMEADGVVFASLAVNGSQNGEEACENSKKIDEILQKLTRIEQLLEQLTTEKSGTTKQIPPIADSIIR